MKKLALILAFIISSYLCYSQVYNNPVARKQSHPELKISSIEITSTETIVSLNITNKRSSGGWFCASSDIYIKNSKGSEVFSMVRSENIPTCPDNYEFKYSEETLEFKLFFPPLPKNIKFIDLVENCSSACFSFYGIILDNQHNENIRAFEKGFELFQNKEYSESIQFFEKVVQHETSVDSHIYGLSYYYLILSNKALGNKDAEENWYKKLLESDIPDKQTFIKELENLENDVEK